MIKQLNGKWCVISHRTQKTLGCFDSEDEAKKHLGRIEHFKATAEAEKGTVCAGLELSKKHFATREAAHAYADSRDCDVMAVSEGSDAWVLTTAMEPIAENSTRTVDVEEGVRAMIGVRKYQVRESVRISETSLRIREAKDPEGKIWEVVIIREGLSKNKIDGRRNYYPAMLLARSAPVFEGVPVFANEIAPGLWDHLPDELRIRYPEGIPENRIGMLRNVRVGESEGKTAILANLVMDEGATWLRKMLLDRLRESQPLPEFSIDAMGSYVQDIREGEDVNLILSFTKVHALDMVTRAAAGGRFTRLVASSKEDITMNLRKLLEALQARFPKWLEGHTIPTDDDAKLGAGVITLLESHRDRAIGDLAGRDPADGAYRSIAKGVQTLTQLVGYAKGNQVETACAVLEGWARLRESDSSAPAYAYPAAKGEGGGKPDDKPKENPEQLAELRRLFEHERTERLLTESLADVEMPKVSKDRIRQMFRGRVASETDIREAIAKEKDYLASLQPQMPGIGSGSSRPQVSKDQKEKYVHAMEGMLSGKDVEGVRRFTSLHQSFRAIAQFYGEPHETARKIFQGIAYAMPGLSGLPLKEHHKMLREACATFASLKEALVTTDWSEIFADAMNKRLVKEYQDPVMDGWRRLVSQTSDLNDTRTQHIARTGGFSDLSDVDEGGTYQEFAKPTDEEVTYVPQKKGNLFAITLETILNDDLRKISRIPRMAARAALRTRSKFFFGLITSNPTMDYDALTLFHATHANTATDALDEAAVQARIIAMMKQTEKDSGERIVVLPRFLMVGPDNWALAQELTMSEVKVNATEDSTVPSTIKKVFRLEPLLDPWLTSTTAWFLIADPMNYETIEAGFVGGRDEPELLVQDAPQIGSVFSADKITHKVRDWFGGDVLDHRAFQRGNT